MLLDQLAQQVHCLPNSEGYTNGNDAVIRGYMRGARLSVVTRRALLEVICAMPGINDEHLCQQTGLQRARLGSKDLACEQLITGSPAGWLSVFPDPDTALLAARNRGLDVDEQLA